MGCLREMWLLEVVLSVDLSHVPSLTLPRSVPLETLPNASFCTKIALKLLNQHSLPGAVSGFGEAVSEAVSHSAAESEGRMCYIFPFRTSYCLSLLSCHPDPMLQREVSPAFGD